MCVVCVYITLIHSHKHVAVQPGDLGFGLRNMDAGQQSDRAPVRFYQNASLQLNILTTLTLYLLLHVSGNVLNY